MSDMGDFYRDIRSTKQGKRKHNREYSASYLQEQGVIFATKNSGAHLIVAHNGTTVDFWPGTGKWNVRHSNKTGRGVKGLVEFLKRRKLCSE
ncbi:MAG: hypothetical protein KAR06_09395 [Deltaproteobacteria bacterium]|nr:hypothetical protein [Deltaproteobacteria bacterium]